MKMNWMGLAFLAFMVSSTVTLQAQSKDFTMQEAVLGLGSNLALKNLKQWQWTGTDAFYAEVKMENADTAIYQTNAAKAGSPASKYMSLNQFNALLKQNNLKEVKAFPALTWKNNNQFDFNAKGQVVRYTNEAGKGTMQVLTAIPEGTEHSAFHAETRQMAYVEKNNLFIADSKFSATKITQDGSKGIVYGESVHRNEFGIEGGLFWSKSGKKLAFYRMDQRMVEDYPIINWMESPAKINNIKYPMAGRKSHEVKVGVYNTENNKLIYVKTGEPKDQYLTCVTWSPDDKFVYVALLNREQNHLHLNQYDATTGDLVKTLFEESDKAYVEPQHDLYFLNNNPDQFVWWSQRDGYMHLYLYKTDGTLIRQLTKGPWILNDIIDYLPASNEILFTASKVSPLDKTVHAVNIKTAKVRDVLATPGQHNITLSGNKQMICDVYNSAQTPRRIALYNTAGKEQQVLLEATNTLSDYRVATVENLQLKADDGTTLYAKLMKPWNFDASKKYPVIVYLYNGPHVQLNKNSFPASGNLWYDYMTQRGYLVFVIDGRGSSNRGLAFEQATHRQLGSIEMNDQLKGVEYLKSLAYVDANRLGVHGWSFGGFMTTSLMLRQPDVFKVGVAGGPVLDWSLYEVMYTERYMDTPKENPDGYKNNLLLDKTKNLKGKLLMIHGADDDVVVWQHSMQFVKKCVDEGKQLDYFVYPGHPHNVRGKDRVHLMQQITDYFDANLK